MKVYLNAITGLDDAVIGNFIENGGLTRDTETVIRTAFADETNRDPGKGTVGALLHDADSTRDWIADIIAEIDENPADFQPVMISYSIYDVPDSEPEPVGAGIMPLPAFAFQYAVRNRGGNMPEYMKDAFGQIGRMITEATGGLIDDSVLLTLADWFRIQSRDN